MMKQQRKGRMVTQLHHVQSYKMYIPWMPTWRMLHSDLLQYPVFHVQTGSKSKYINSLNSFFFLKSKVSETSSISVYRQADTKPNGQSETANLITDPVLRNFMMIDKVQETDSNTLIITFSSTKVQTQMSSK